MSQAFPCKPWWRLTSAESRIRDVCAQRCLLNKKQRCLLSSRPADTGIQRRLREAGNEIADEADIIGRHGLPNRIPVPAGRHTKIHSGKGYIQNGGVGSGHYNNAFHRLIVGKNGNGPGHKNVTKEHVLEIREFLVRQFGLQ